MSDSIAITMLPAREGDCLLLNYGPENNKKHILVDGGRAWTYKNALKDYLETHGINHLELIIVTHVDRDHIDGMLQLVQDEDLNLKVGEIWFNTYEHLQGETVDAPDQEDEIESFGAKMGEELSAAIMEKKWPWNKTFAHKAVELANCPEGQKIQLGDLSFTLLSPNRTKLEELIPNWEKECQKAGITPGYQVEDYQEEDDEIESFGGIDIDELADEEFNDDTSPANGSSIALLLEYKNKRFLLSGDAHVDILLESLKNQGASNDTPLHLDAFKVPHHGSKHNLSKELLDLLSCENYLVSTSGSYFKHPDNIAMSRLIKYGTADSTLCFNYKTEFNEIWDEKNWKADYKYETRYPEDDNDGYLTIKFEV